MDKEIFKLIKIFNIHSNVHLSKIFDIEGPVFVEVITDPEEAHEPRVVAQLDENNNFIPGELHSIKWLK